MDCLSIIRTFYSRPFKGTFSVFFFREELEREKAVLEQRIIQYQVSNEFICYLLTLFNISVITVIIGIVKGL